MFRESKVRRVEISGLQILLDVIVKGMEVFQSLDKNIGWEDYGYEMDDWEDLKEVMKEKKKEIEKSRLVGMNYVKIFE